MEIVHAGELYIPDSGIEPWSPELRAESPPLSHQGSPGNPLFAVSDPQRLPTSYGTSSTCVTCHLQRFSVNCRLPPQPDRSALFLGVSHLLPRRRLLMSKCRVTRNFSARKSTLGDHPRPPPVGTPSALN